MNALVVYDSTFGNTDQVARAIAQALEERGPVRLAAAIEAREVSLKGIDLLVAGGPTQRRGLSPAMRAWLDRVPALDGVAVAAFDTRYRMARWLSGSAGQAIARGLRRKGAREVVPPESFFVREAEGPLLDGELDRAAAWARTIAGASPAPAAAT